MNALVSLFIFVPCFSLKNKKTEDNISCLVVFSYQSSCGCGSLSLRRLLSGALNCQSWNPWRSDNSCSIRDKCVEDPTGPGFRFQNTQKFICASLVLGPPIIWQYPAISPIAGVFSNKLLCINGLTVFDTLGHFCEQCMCPTRQVRSLHRQPEAQLLGKVKEDKEVVYNFMIHDDSLSIFEPLVHAWICLQG